MLMPAANSMKSHQIVPPNLNNYADNQQNRVSQNQLVYGLPD